MAVVSKTKRLTKEDILEGIKKRKSVYVREYDREVMIRPLSDGELSKIFSIIGPVQILPDGTPDTSKVELDKNFEALRLATTMGLTEPQLTLEEVANMTFGVPAEIGMEVLEYSGVAPPELAKKKDLK